MGQYTRYPNGFVAALAFIWENLLWPLLRVPIGFFGMALIGWLLIQMMNACQGRN